MREIVLKNGSSPAKTGERNDDHNGTTVSVIQPNHLERSSPVVTYGMTSVCADNFVLVASKL